MRRFFRYSFARGGAGPAFRWLIAGCALVGVAAAQQSSATLHNMAGIADAPRPSLLLGQTPVSSPAVNPQDGRLYLSLQEAFRMALKNNLDIEVEQLDQTIADLSVPLTEGGGLPRAINYTVADTPAGEAAVAVPLLSFSSPGLSPLSVDPITSTVFFLRTTRAISGRGHTRYPWVGARTHWERLYPVSMRWCWAGMDGCGVIQQFRSPPRGRRRRWQTR